MSYANLAGISRGQCNTIMRDIAEFKRFGVTTETVSAFRSLVEEFDNTPKDEELRGVVMNQTADKNEQAEQVKTLIREIALFVKQSYKKNSGIYSALDIYDLSDKNDFALYRSASSVVRTVRTLADKFQPELQNVANELETVNNLFNQKIEDKRIAIEGRNIATNSRVELANSIYTKLISLTSLGAGIWAERNEAKYNDYVIYGSSAAASPPNNSENGDERDKELSNG